MTEAARLAQLLASRLQAVWGAAAEITGIQRLPGGASRESWGVQARMADGAEHRLILFRDPGRSDRDRDVAVEAAAMVAAYWVINGEKTWNTGVHTASHDLIFARTSGAPGSGEGITTFLVPVDAAGFTVKEYLWTFNMPTDHAHVSLTGVRVPGTAILRGEGRGLAVVQHFFNENRIRQAASSLGAAQFCIDRSVEYAKSRAPFGQPLASHQAIQFPLVELQTQCEMLSALIHKTAWGMDQHGPLSQSNKVSMCNFVANRLCCDAADRAMQVHGVRSRDQASVLARSQG